jgi:hypothetical protein
MVPPRLWVPPSSEIRVSEILVGTGLSVAHGTITITTTRFMHARVYVANPRLHQDVVYPESERICQVDVKRASLISNNTQRRS